MLAGTISCLSDASQKSAKRFVELRGFRPDIDADGWPVDRKHPVYREG